MLQSQLFTKTRKEAPKDEVSQNAVLLIKAGYIHKEMAGVYSYLPLGLRVLNKISDIIRKHINALGGQEIEMTVLQNPEIWKKTGRFDIDVAFETEIKNGGKVKLGWTHEEAVTNILTNHVSSYKDLPLAIYQIQTKFRNEERAKSGIMRGREFLMKDLYSFHANQADFDIFYERAAEAYNKIFAEVGLGDITYKTFASGGAFSKFSHEFQTLSEAGEDTIYVCDKKKIAINKEVMNDEVLADLGVAKEDLQEKKAIEVGNIFNLGTRFSEPLNLNYKDEKGESRPVIMGCYGIGPGRVMGAVVEANADDKGIVWPESVAPFKIHLVPMAYDKSEQVKKQADGIYQKLLASGVEALMDDRAVSAGEKFADSDLLGLPYRAVVSEKNGDQIELKNRKTGEVKMLTPEEFFNFIADKK